jgi:hypothetical protein
VFLHGLVVPRSPAAIPIWWLRQQLGQLQSFIWRWASSRAWTTMMYAVFRRHQRL